MMQNKKDLNKERILKIEKIVSKKIEALKEAIECIEDHDCDDFALLLDDNEYECMWCGNSWEELT